MKIKLNKKKIKNLSKDNKALPVDMTRHIAGGNIHNELTVGGKISCLCVPY